MQLTGQAGENETSPPFPGGGMAGTFMLSFDCEGKWGLVDCLSERHQQLYTTANLEEVYRRLGSLLRKYGLDATFAFTAAFSLSREGFDRLQPELDDPGTRAEPWVGRALSAIARDNGQGWFAPACFDIVREPGCHEIACHGFSHLPWRASYATRAVLEAELAMCRKVPALSDKSVRTFVFPRNQVAHQDLLAAHGFFAYRKEPSFSSRSANFVREFNLLSPSEHVRLDDGASITALPAGHFLNWRHGLRRFVPAAVTVRRWKNMIRDAARGGGLVHAWTHPENFVDGHDMFSMLEEILRFAADEREAGRLQVLTSTQFVASTARSPQISPFSFTTRPSKPDSSPDPSRQHTPLVSIGMAVLNGGAELNVAVQSVLAQTMADWELLLIDDGSTDGATDAIAALNDERIRLIRDGKNKGLAVRLNEMLDMARGRYFARMDHDDVSHPDRLRRQVAALEADADLDLLACRCIRLGDGDRLTAFTHFATSHEDICRHAWLRFPMAHPTWCGRLEWFRRHRYPVPAPFYAEDFELLLRAFECSKYAVLPQVLLAYRVRSRIELKKALRARRAQLSVQLGYFRRKRQLNGVVMAAGAFLLRLGFDGCRAGAQAAGISFDLHRAADPGELAEWRKVIEGYRLRIREVANVGHP